MQTKADIRKEMKAAKARLSDSEKREAARRCFAQVASMPEFQAARNILVYHALPDEIPTDEFLREWDGRKRLFLPRIAGEQLDILAYDAARLSTGAFHIQEPTGDTCFDVREMNLIIVPGVAFDRSGNRLGRGKGFYDRLLQEATCPKVGVGYACQMVGLLPAEEHDIPMDAIVTEEETIRRIEK